MTAKLMYTACALLVCGAALMAAVDATARQLTCYTCSGINCQRTTRNATAQCLDPLDYCVTVFDRFKVVHKGCSLEVPIELRRRCDANTPDCHKCYANGCNQLGPNNLQCLQCDSSKDAKCLSDPASIAPTRCPAATAGNAYCFVKYSGTGVTQRGCALSTKEQLACYDSGNCALCLPGDVDACNRFDFAANTRAGSL